MAYITREYDDRALLETLISLKDDFRLPAGTQVTDFDLTPPVSNGKRKVQLTIEIPVSPGEIDTLLANPTA